MNRKTLSIICFIVGFVATYAILCLIIPNGIKWVEEATPMQMFIGHILYMGILKCVVSAVLGIIIGAIPLLKGKKEN